MQNLEEHNLENTVAGGSLPAPPLRRTFWSRPVPVLTGAGILAALLVFAIGGISDFLSGRGDQIVPEDTSYPRLAPDMDQNVGNALNAANVVEPASFGSNFNDLLGAGKSNVPTLSDNSPKSATLAPLSVKANTFPAERLNNPANNPATTNSTTAVLPVESSSTALDRLAERNNQIRRGNQTVAPLPEIYDIEEVTPLGVVGDRRKREVLFYSPVTKQTFSVPLGTRFRNGTLEDAAGDEQTVEGVRFRRQSDNSLQTKTWATRDESNKTSDSASQQPILKKENVEVPRPRPKRQ